MKTPACEPCARRKVKCDRALPRCSNCKRRRHDRCVFPETTATDRIKQLEQTVQSLRSERPGYRNPEVIVADTDTEKVPEAGPLPETMMHEADRTIYAESQGWQAWMNLASAHHGSKADTNTAVLTANEPNQRLPQAMSFASWTSPAPALVSIPIPLTKATYLWSVFLERVHPVLKLSFPWTLVELEQALTDQNKWAKLGAGDQALVIAYCYFASITVGKAEAVDMLGESRAALRRTCRQCCEEALSRCNLLMATDTSTIKALCVYIKASIDVVAVQSLFTLAGLLSRSAELLGLHLSGTLPKLSPVQKEDNNRTWWQIQHLELILAIKNGITPLTFTADWDAEFPLNIEDDDLSPSSSSTPPERTGLTSMSYVRFACYMILHQRRIRRGHAPQVEQSILSPLKGDIIQDLEQGLQQTFLQYCDPVDPMHSLLQISARAVVCVLRLRTMHAQRVRMGGLDKASLDKFFRLCLQLLGYTLASYRQHALKPFLWLAEASCGWHALISLLLDLPLLEDTRKMKDAWKFLDDLFAEVPFLTDLEEDDRRLRAAELVLVSWNTCQKKLDNFKPALIPVLEDKLAAIHEGGLEIMADSHPTVETVGTDDTAVDDFQFNFSDIDWAFWDSAISSGWMGSGAE